MRCLPDHKPAKIKSMLRHGQFAVNGTPSTQYDQPVDKGDELWVKFNGSFNVFSHSKVRLLYEDADLLVVDKSSGFLSTAPTVCSPREKDNNVLAVMLKYLRKDNPSARLYPVHRLDRETSGVMLLARNSKTRERFTKEWSSLVVERRFVLVVDGKVAGEKGEIKTYIADDPETHLARCTDDRDRGKLAVTRYAVVKRGNARTMIETTQKSLVKGQLRAHAAHIGHPVCGDRAYGGNYTPLRRMAVHASTLTIVHPVTGKMHTFSSPVPEGFEELLEWAPQPRRKQ